MLISASTLITIGVALIIAGLVGVLVAGIILTLLGLAELLRPVALRRR